MAWGLTMAVLVKRQREESGNLEDYSAESLFGSVEVLRTWRDIEDYMVILQSGKPVGASLTEIRQDKNQDTTLTITMDFRLSAKPSDVLPTIEAKAFGHLNNKLELEAFFAKANAGPLTLNVNGLSTENELYLKATNFNNISYSRRQLKEPMTLTEAVRPALGSQMTIAPGQTLRTPVLDPLTGKSHGLLMIAIGEKEAITVDGEEVQGFRVVTKLHDIESIMWVDATGRTLKRNLFGNLTMERTSREKALEVAPSLAKGVAIPPLDIEEFPEQTVPDDGGNPAPAGSSALGLLGRILQ